METAEITLGPVSWERMSAGIEKVKDRLRRAVEAMDGAAIPYAVIGGNAVAAWVSRVDDSVVRNTRDVDLLVRRADMPAIKVAMAALVTMKLTSYRDRDRVHLRDMISIGQIDETWLNCVPELLRGRLRALLDDP